MDVCTRCPSDGSLRSLSYLAVLLLVSCGDNVGAGAPGDGLDHLRAELLKKLQSSPCPGAPCPAVTFTAQPAAALDVSRGQRILLLDDAIVLQGIARWP